MTPAEFEIRKRQIQAQVSAGDISPVVGKRLIEQAWLTTQTVEEREAFKDVVKLDEQLARQRDALVAIARSGPVNPPAAGASPFKQSQFKKSEQLRQLFLSGNWETIFDRIPFFYWKDFTKPRIKIAAFRFVLQNGKKVYVPYSDAELVALAQRAHPVPPMYSPPQSQRENIAKDLIAKQKQAAQNYPESDQRHVLQTYPTDVTVERPKPSTWETLKKPVLIAAGIIAAAYLGPIVVDKIGGYFGQSAATSTGTSTETAKATFFQQVKSGANNVLQYVNKARTVEAIAKGELPPPPIGITGNSFKEWVFNVAKQEIQNEAKQKAAELGQEYIQRELTKQEEQKIRDEIATMQRELERLIPETLPKEPSPNVPSIVQKRMIDEKQASEQMNNILLVAAPLALAYFLT